MNHEDETPEVEEGEAVESGQPTVTFTVNFVEAEPKEPLPYGRRYKRPSSYPRQRILDWARKTGEYGDTAIMQAVFDSRAAYFQDNPKRETFEEILEDSRDLRMVLADFPGLWDFIGEMETARLESHRRLLTIGYRNEIIEQTRQQLSVVTNELEKVSEAPAQLREALSQLKRIAETLVPHVEQVDLNNIEAVTEEMVEEIYDLRDKVEIPPNTRIKSHKVFAEELGISPSWLSDVLDKMRGEKLIHTPKGGRITLIETERVVTYINNPNSRPERRGSKNLPNATEQRVVTNRGSS